MNVLSAQIVGGSMCVASCLYVTALRVLNPTICPSYVQLWDHGPWMDGTRPDRCHALVGVARQGRLVGLSFVRVLSYSVRRYDR